MPTPDEKTIDLILDQVKRLHTKTDALMDAGHNLDKRVELNEERAKLVDDLLVARISALETKVQPVIEFYEGTGFVVRHWKAAIIGAALLAYTLFHVDIGASITGLLAARDP